ncbi:MAG: hypothetical protein ABH843_01305 [Candidatus Omnitrophota bacterium]
MTSSLFAAGPSASLRVPREGSRAKARERRLLLLATLSFLLLTSHVAYAKKTDSIKAFYATGERSQTDEIEERDLSGGYSFYKYGTTVRSKSFKDIYYRLGYTGYEKDFDTERNNLDNRTDVYNVYISSPIHKTETSKLELSADYSLRAKRYDNSSSLEYDQNNITAALDVDIDKNYSLELAGGIKDYEYINNSSSDTTKAFLKIAPAIKNDAASVSGYYKRGWVNQSDSKKDYSEDSLSVRTSFKFDSKLLYKVGGHFGYGKNDTRDSDEDREDNLRFEYRLWDITTEHKLDESADTQFTYGQKYREYLTSISGYENWFLKNRSRLNLFKKESFKVDLLLGGEHKETRFYVNEGLSYAKNSVSGGLSMLERADWSLKPDLSFTKYDYQQGSTNSQKAYKLSVDIKKYLGGTDTALEANYWYKWKDYEYKGDVKQWSLNLSYEIKF